MEPIVLAGLGVVAGWWGSKPVRQAIGRLIAGTADVPQAYLERWAGEIRTDTAARRAMTEEVATVARSAAKDDRHLVDRGIERWTRQLGARQSSRENVARAAIEALSESELPSAAGSPSEDFMRVFEKMAEEVSSDELVDLLGRILAGEIRAPGSVPRRTLATVAVLEQEIVTALALVKPFLLDGAWLHMPPTTRGMWWPRVALLNSVSIMSEPGMHNLRYENGTGIARIGNEALLVGLKPPGIWMMDGAHLTPTGRELISLLPLPAETKVPEIAQGLWELEFVEQVRVGDVQEEVGKFRVVNLREIERLSAQAG